MVYVYGSRDAGTLCTCSRNLKVRKNHARGSNLLLCCDATAGAIVIKVGWSSDLEVVIKYENLEFSRASDRKSAFSAPNANSS
jgi:hypothetical protein